MKNSSLTSFSMFYLDSIGLPCYTTTYKKQFPIFLSFKVFLWLWPYLLVAINKFINTYMNLFLLSDTEQKK